MVGCVEIRNSAHIQKLIDQNKLKGISNEGNYKLTVRMIDQLQKKLQYL